MIRLLLVECIGVDHTEAGSLVLDIQILHVLGLNIEAENRLPEHIGLNLIVNFELHITRHQRLL